MDAKVESGAFAHGRSKKILSVKGYQMTTQRFLQVKASYFADCSGDSILAPLSEAEFDYGREAAEEFGEDTEREERDRMVMGMSCLIQGRQTHRPVPFIPSEFATKLSAEDVKNRPMDLYDPTENFWYLELGGSENTIDDAETTKERLYSLALGAWDHIKNSGQYDADSWELEFLGALPAKRESRRMRGEYVISQRDISEGRVFEDTVAFGGWPLDDHYPAGYYHKGTPNTDFKTPSPYCLPYRALYSSNVENLFFAGRNISMTHMAMSSIRVMATCALLGQAVGSAAAIATAHSITPHDVYLSRLKDLQELLMNDDCFLPHFKRPISKACLDAELVGADESIRSGEDRANRIYGTETCGCEIRNGKSVTYQLRDDERVHSVHLVFDSDLDRETLPGHWCERTHVTRANILLDSPQMYPPKTLCRAFRLTADTPAGEVTLCEVTQNKKRAYHIPLPPDLCVSSLRLTLLDNWGERDSTNLISFDFQ